MAEAKKPEPNKAQIKMRESIKRSAKRSEYVGAEMTPTSKILNIPFKVKGMVIHMATVGRPDKLNIETGELEAQYGQAERTVFKKEDGTFVSFVASTIVDAARTYFKEEDGFPEGDWEFEGESFTVPIVIRQETKGDKRYYVLQVIDDEQ